MPRRLIRPMVSVVISGRLCRYVLSLISFRGFCANIGAQFNMRSSVIERTPYLNSSDRRYRKMNMPKEKGQAARTVGLMQRLGSLSTAIGPIA